MMAVLQIILLNYNCIANMQRYSEQSSIKHNNFIQINTVEALESFYLMSKVRRSKMHKLTLNYLPLVIFEMSWLTAYINLLKIRKNLIYLCQVKRNYMVRLKRFILYLEIILLSTNEIYNILCVIFLQYDNPLAKYFDV